MPSACSVSGAHLCRLPILGLAQCSFDRIHTVPVVHLGAASFFFHAAAYLHRYAAALAVPRCSPTRTRRTTTLRHRCSASARQGLAPRQVSDTGASHPRLWSSPCPHQQQQPPWTLMQGGSWDQSSLANNVSTMLLMSPPSTEWYADFGAGSHMVNTAGILSASHPLVIYLVLHLSFSVTEPCFLLPPLGHTRFPHHGNLFFFLMFLSPQAILRV
jgi:hypothetical protein